jgi:hypothetical protein
MASPTKPPAPLRPLSTSEPEREFEAAVERVQRRETTAPRKGFDEERQFDEPAQEADARDQAELEEDAPMRAASPDLWTPFSDNE